MILTKEQIVKLLKLSRPLLRWMNKNADPHCKVIITNDSVEMVSGVVGIPCQDYIKG